MRNIQILCGFFYDYNCTTGGVFKRNQKKINNETLSNIGSNYDESTTKIILRKTCFFGKNYLFICLIEPTSQA